LIFPRKEAAMIRLQNPGPGGELLRFALAALILLQPLVIDSALARDGRYQVPDAVPTDPITDRETWWDGFGPSAQGGLGLNDSGWAAVVFEGKLIVGGRFTQAGDLPVSRIAAFDGLSETWSALGDGFTGPVMALAVYQDELYAGGFFNYSGATPIAGIARWDGAQWQPVAGGVTPIVDYVLELEVVGDQLYVGGNFDQIGGVAANNIARWDGEQFHALGQGVENSAIDWAEVYDIGELGGDVIASGWFDTAGGAPAGNIALWDGAAWNDMGGFADNYVFDSEPLFPDGREDEELLVAGCFYNIGGLITQYVALFGLGSWLPFTVLLMSAPIFAAMSFMHLGVRQTLLMGHFLHAGAFYAGFLMMLFYVAGVLNHAFLGPGLGGPAALFPGVFAAAIYMGFLFVLGEFTQIGEYTERAPGTPSLNIARYGAGDYTPVLLSFLEIGAEGSTVRARWELTEDSDAARFHLVGSQGEESWELPVMETAPGSFEALDTHEALLAGGEFGYRLYHEEDGDWQLLRSESVLVEAQTPGPAALLPAYPNPFNPKTFVSFELPEAQRVRLGVYDGRGRLLRVLADGEHTRGRHSVTWDGRDEAGRDLPAGVYFTRLELRGGSESGKLVLLR